MLYPGFEALTIERENWRDSQQTQGRRCKEGWWAEVRAFASSGVLSCRAVYLNVEWLDLSIFLLMKKRNAEQLLVAAGLATTHAMPTSCEHMAPVQCLPVLAANQTISTSRNCQRSANQPLQPSLEAIQHSQPLEKTSSQIESTSSGCLPDT